MVLKYSPIILMLILLASSVTAQFVGHQASSITEGTFDPGNYTFPNDLSVLGVLSGLIDCSNITGSTSNLCTLVDTDTDTQKGTSGPYLYNDSTIIYFNETKLNSTIIAVSPITPDTWVNESGDTMTGDLFMTANVIPTIDNTYSLGNSTNGWDTIYATDWIATSGQEVNIWSDSDNARVKLRGKGASGSNEGALEFNDGIKIQTGALADIAYFKDTLETEFYGDVNVSGVLLVEGENSSLTIDPNAFSAGTKMTFGEGGNTFSQFQAFGTFQVQSLNGPLLFNSFGDHAITFNPNGATVLTATDDLIDIDTDINMGDNDVVDINRMNFTDGGYMYDNGTALILGHN